MRLPAPITGLLDNWASRFVASRPISFAIGGAEDPYLLRWYVTPWSRWNHLENKTRWQRALGFLPNIYCHIFLRSDDDRALHDHPWANCSIVLSGSYIETTSKEGVPRQELRLAGSVVFRRAATAHRISLFEDSAWRTKHVLTLFFTGPKVREWGFHCPKAWRHWKIFTAYSADGNSARIGRGCE